MLFYTAIIVLLSTNFVTAQVVSTPSSSPTTVPPGTLQTNGISSRSPPLTPSTVPATTASTTAEEELQKVIKLTQGLSVIISFFNSTESLGKNVKAVLEASRACGLVLYHGLSMNEIKDTKEKANLDDVTKQLDDVVGEMNSKMSTAEAEVMSRKSMYFIKNSVINPAEILFFSFRGMTNQYDDFKKEDNDYFKYTCSRYSTNLIFHTIKLSFILNNVNDTIVDDNYSDVVYESLYKIYYNVIKKVIALHPMCHIIQSGPPDLNDRQDIVSTTFDVIKAFHSNFTTINNERKEKYWSNDNIFEIVKKHLLGDITFDGPYTGDNKKIAKNIYKYLAKNYGYFGYTYHVGISNSGTNGNADTLIQCSTECKYIYGINNKDVYIIRNKQVPVYKECNLLSSRRNDVYGCRNDRDSTDLTEYAQKIQSECDPASFSLVRSRMNYQYAGDDDEYVRINGEYKDLPSGFSQNCFGDIHVVMAKNY